MSAFASSQALPLDKFAKRGFPGTGRADQDNCFVLAHVIAGARIDFYDCLIYRIRVHYAKMGLGLQMRI